MNDKTVALLITNTISFDTKIETSKHTKIFAIDGGANYLFNKKIIPEIIFGDLDSISDEAKTYFNKKTKFIQYKKNKDETDTELAIKYCSENSINKIVIYNSLAGRFDHVIGLLSNLEFASDLGLDVQIKNNQYKLFIINEKTIVVGEVGKMVSLIPISESVNIESTNGLEYNLANEKLFRNKTRGISNVLTRKRAVINITAGKLLIVLEES